MLVESTIRLKFPTPHIWLTKIIGLSNIGLRKLIRKKLENTIDFTERKKSHCRFLYFLLFIITQN